MRWGKAAGLALWELPQNVLGAVTLACAYARSDVRDLTVERSRIFVRTGSVGVSLGAFVFWFEEGNRYFLPDPLMKRHEWGHTFQSRWLGPLYLPVVGVPSSLRALYAIVYRERTGRRWRGYFDAFPESSADRLGGITPAERADQLAGMRV